MRELFARWRRLPADRRRLLWRALAAVLSTRMLLWVLPFRAWRRVSHRRIDLLGTSRQLPPRPTVKDVAWAIAHSARLVPRATCLTQAVAARALFAGDGRTSEVHVGVRRRAKGRLEAHAWLELNGSVVLGQSIVPCRRLGRLPLPSAAEPVELPGPRASSSPDTRDR